MFSNKGIACLHSASCPPVRTNLIGMPLGFLNEFAALARLLTRQSLMWHKHQENTAEGYFKDNTCDFAFVHCDFAFVHGDILCFKFDPCINSVRGMGNE